MLPFCKEERENKAPEKTQSGWNWCTKSFLVEVRQFSLWCQSGVRDPQTSRLCLLPSLSSPHSPWHFSALPVPNTPEFTPCCCFYEPRGSCLKHSNLQLFCPRECQNVTSFIHGQNSRRMLHSLCCVAIWILQNTAALWHHFLHCCLFWVFPEPIVLHFSLDIHLLWISTLCCNFLDHRSEMLVLL